MTLRALVIKYAAFAGVAMLANLATQRLVLHGAQTGSHFALGVGAGTLVGLLIKYVLDKRWIFYDLETGAKNHSRKFTLYLAMGLVTTGLFWGTETAFWLIWQTDRLRELGALVGLSIGYFIKYNLDRRFVFKPAHKYSSAGHSSGGNDVR